MGVQLRRFISGEGPLAPIMFLLVAAGPSGLMRQAFEVGLFRGFSLRDSSLVVSHMLYADDTLLNVMSTVRNLWTKMAVLRCFELESGLKVNFS